MNRMLTLTIAVMLAAVTPLRAQDKPPPKPAELPAMVKQLNEITEAFDVEVNKRLESAKTDEAKQALIGRLHEFGGPFAEKALKLAQSNPKDPTALQAALFAIIAGRNEKAVDLIVAEMQDHKQLTGAMMELAMGMAENPTVETLAKALAGKATDKKVKAHATLGLAKIKVAQAEKETDPKKTEALFKQAEEWAAALEKDFPQVEGPQERMGETAKKLLFAVRHLTIGKPVPEVVSRDLNDKEVKLSSYKGKVVVLDIWATWCLPCRKMIPHEREMVEKLKDKPFALISVSADEKKEELTEFLKTEKMPWIHWWEGGKKDGFLSDWNVEFFPTIYVIDAKGVIRYKHVRGKELDEAVAKLIKEAEEKK